MCFARVAQPGGCSSSTRRARPAGSPRVSSPGCSRPASTAASPGSPATKAALLFDMLVSCASIQGISWLEAAGAIHAENQVLRLLADLAGLPPEAGGAFVSGGSAGNLSALAVARETAKARRADAGGDQP